MIPITIARIKRQSRHPRTAFVTLVKAVESCILLLSVLVFSAGCPDSDSFPDANDTNTIVDAGASQDLSTVDAGASQDLSTSSQDVWLDRGTVPDSATGDQVFTPDGGQRDVEEVDAGYVSPQLRITEVAWMGSVSNAADEWIEIQNISADDIELSEWSLVESATTLPLPATTIAPGDYVILAASESSFTNAPVDLVVVAMQLDDSGEVLRLCPSDSIANENNCDIANPDGDAWFAGSNQPKATMTRVCDSEPCFGYLASNWESHTAAPSSYTDSGDRPVPGTPAAGACRLDLPAGFELLDCNPRDFQDSMRMDAAITTNGVLHILYSRLQLPSRKQQAWIASVPATGSPSYYPFNDQDPDRAYVSLPLRLEVMSNGDPLVTYQAPDTRLLHIARVVDGELTDNELVYGDGILYQADLCVHDDIISIYANQSNERDLLLTKQGNDWATLETVYTGNMFDTTLKYDTTGRPHVAFWNEVTVIKYGTLTEQGWTSESLLPIDAHRVDSGSLSMQVDSAGVVHIAYPEGYSHWEIWYGNNASGTFSQEQIDADIDYLYLAPALALDSDDRPHLLYTRDDQYGNKVVHAWKTLNGWQQEVVVDGSMKQGVLVFDGNGTLHMIMWYYGNSGGAGLLHGTWAP